MFLKIVENLFMREENLAVRADTENGTFCVQMHMTAAKFLLYIHLSDVALLISINFEL